MTKLAFAISQREGTLLSYGIADEDDIQFIVQVAAAGNEAAEKLADPEKYAPFTVIVGPADGTGE